MYTKLLRNITWLGSASIAVKPLWFIFITAFCVRMLGVSGYGILTAALSLATLSFSFTDLGLSQYTVREVARDHSRASAFFTNFVVVRLTLAVAAAGVAVTAGLLLDYSRPLLLAVVVACGYQTMQIITSYSRLFFQAFEVLKFEAISVIVEKILVIAFGLMLLYTIPLPGWTLFGMTVGMGLTALLNLWWVDRRLASFNLKTLDFSFIRNVLKAAIPFGIASIFSIFYFRVDTIMVEAMIDETALGRYGLAFRIVEALNMLPLIVARSAVFPRLSRLYEDRETMEFSRLTRLSSLGLGGISLAITFGIFLAAPLIINLIDPSPDIAPAATALKVLCWTFPLTSVRSLLYVALISIEQQRFLAKTLGGAVAFNMILNFILIPYLGINGASLATVISEAVLLGVYVVRYRRSKTRMFSVPQHQPTD